MHALESADGATLPGAQGEQAFCPVPDEVPAGQAAHSVAPVFAEKVPGVHSRQAVAPT